MFKDMLRQLRTENGYSMDDLVAKYNRRFHAKMNKSTLSRYENGLQEPMYSTVANLAKLFGVTSDFLIGNTDDPVFHIDNRGTLHETNRQEKPSEYGSAPELSREESAHIKKYRLLDIYNKRLVDDVMDAAYNRMTKNVNPMESGVTYIKCYELPASAGTGEPLGDTYYTDMIKIPLERVPDNAHLCIRVHGDSMEPAYHDGDIVMVERLGGESVREGEIGIFTLNGEGYIKRLGYQELISLNSQYDPIPIHDYDDLRCLGRVLGKV